MQNIPAPPASPGSTDGVASSAKKSGLSKGCLVGIVLAAVFVLAGLVVVALAAGGLYWFKRQASSITTTNSPGGSKTSRSSSNASDDSSGAENPAPTSAQSDAVAGGQSATWTQQEISWTVPQKWHEQTADSRSFLWRSPGSWDAANLIVSISPMNADFPAEISLKAFYEGAQTRKQNGEVDEVRWLKLDGVKGIEFRESAPEDAESPQRLQWMAYRNYKGQLQLVNIMLSARGKDFARHEDALHGILYTTKFSE